MGSPSAAGLTAVAADVQWPDAAAAAAVEYALPPGTGELGGLARWIAGAQGTATPHRPQRVRAVLLDTAPSAVSAAAAERIGIDLLAIEVSRDLDRAAATGAALADKSADEGCELLVVAGGDPSNAAATVVCLVTGAEPVSLLPRGAGAVDTQGWIARATALRDDLRAVTPLREDPDQLLVALGSSELACAAELLMRAAARRTLVLVDGPLALAAAVLCQDIQARAGQWLRPADAHPDAVAQRAIRELAHPTVLGLGLGLGFGLGRDGLAGILAAGLVLAAGDLAADAAATDSASSSDSAGAPGVLR